MDTEAMKMKMTQAEFARHLGVTRQAVNQAIKRHNIETDEKGRVNPVVLDGILGPTNASADLTNSKAKIVHFKAMQAEVDYMKSVGKLIDVELVTESMERCAEMMVRDMEQFPAHADELANQDTATVKKKLKALIYDLRKTMADNLVILGETELEKEHDVAGHGAAANGSGKPTYARYRTA